MCCSSTQRSRNEVQWVHQALSLGCFGFCFRNPDGDKKPWCFIKANSAKVKWEYCDVPACPALGKTVAVQRPWWWGGCRSIDRCSIDRFPISPTFVFPPHLLYRPSSQWQPNCLVLHTPLGMLSSPGDLCKFGPVAQM